VDYGRFRPAMDRVFSAFPADYWSSTSYTNADRAWTVNFEEGYDYNRFTKDSSNPFFYVRAVRGGM
jgi:hypothetical protein